MGGVLAHAFYPPYGGEDGKYGISGDMHFDLTEKFAVNGGPGIDILQVKEAYLILNVRIRRHF